MSTILSNGIYMTQREIELNVVREEGRRAYRYYVQRNPHKGVDEAKESAWNDGWVQAADEARGDSWY